MAKPRNAFSVFFVWGWRRLKKSLVNLRVAINIARLRLEIEDSFDGITENLEGNFSDAWAILEERSAQTKHIQEKISVLQTIRLEIRARRSNVTIGMVPLPSGQQSHYQPNSSALTQSSRLAFLELIETAEHKRSGRRSEMWFKIVTAIGAVVAAATGLYSAFFKSSN